MACARLTGAFEMGDPFPSLLTCPQVRTAGNSYS
jgi:hypothetical protein